MYILGDNKNKIKIIIKLWVFCLIATWLYNFLTTYPYAEPEARKFFKANRNRFEQMVYILEKQYLVVTGNKGIEAVIGGQTVDESERWVKFYFSDNGTMLYRFLYDSWRFDEGKITCDIDKKDRKIISKFINATAISYPTLTSISIDDDVIVFNFIEGWEPYIFLKSNKNEKEILSKKIDSLFKIFHISEKWYWAREADILGL